MLTTIVGKKLGQTQGFLENGARIPMTKIDVSSNVVTQIKTHDKEGYNAIQLGFGENKKSDKPTIGHAKKAGLTKTPRFFIESRQEKVEEFELGASVKVEEVLSAGDIVDITGTSKGKGYAGVVKRHHFRGGPKTHGQSDRHRAPGSIGQSTTPGRVYKGKRMAGRMGVDQVTIKNLEVIEVKDGILLVKGLVPGHISSILAITRRGQNKKHVGLYQVQVESEVVEKVEEIGESIEDQEEARKEVQAQEKVEEAAEKELEKVNTDGNVSNEASVEDKNSKVSDETIKSVEDIKDEENVEESTEKESVEEKELLEEKKEE